MRAWNASWPTGPRWQGKLSRISLVSATAASPSHPTSRWARLLQEAQALRVLWRLVPFLREERLRALGALSAMLAGAGVQLLIPHLMQRILDEGIAQGREDRVLALGAGLLGLGLARAGLAAAELLLSAYVTESTARRLRLSLYARLQRLAFSFHDQAQTGQLLTRLVQDINLIRDFLGNTLLSLLAALLLLLGSLVFMAYAQPPLALLTLALAPLAALIYAVFFVLARPLFHHNQHVLADVTTVLQENLSGIRVVRALVRQDEERRRFAQASAALRDQQLRIGRLTALLFPLFGLVANLGTLGIWWVGGLRIMAGAMTVGQLVAFSNYLLLALGPLFMLSSLMLSLARAATGAERLFEVLDAPDTLPEAPDAYPLPPLRGAIRFEHVWFRYFPHQPWVLQDVSFCIAPGQKVALVGTTGAGKSTLANLIPRFYDPTLGRVLVDGHDLRAVTLASLRQQIGIVMQDTLVLKGRVRDVIAFGRPEASLEDIMAAAQAAQAHEFILRLPQGYDTPIGERGATLSGGQRQRLALARALLIEPRLVILDDATSQLDGETAGLVQQALERLLAGRTALIIAQRAATLRQADWILMLDQGRLVAQGRHEDLLEHQALYAWLYYEYLEQD